ncbi:MAG: sigma-70 family RNA polymerase sigma factor [Oscillospiraceae bacterium]|nr:sigma-70 family RNA polymerase sigma factor [Oscillospiraceae bacterium]
MEDREIIKLYLERSENAIAETNKKYRKYCYSIAYNILHDTEDSEETVNDAYLGAWNSIPPNVPDVLQTFLGRITRNISLKKIRARNAQKRGSGEFLLVLDEMSELIPSGHDTEKDTEAKEFAQLINTFLRSLPETERKVFVCRYWYFDSIADISKQFGFTKSKVKSMLFRTRQKLFIKLETEDYL